jgi:hypothetical protein
MQERIARAIYEGRNGAKCKPWAHQPKAHREPYLLDALAAMKAMREPTEERSRSSELGAKVRKVAAQLSVERFNGWANPLVSDLVDAADFLEGKKPIQDSSDAVLSLDAEISIAEGGKDG